jgi:hypothetical protein
MTRSSTSHRKSKTAASAARKRRRHRRTPERRDEPKFEKFFDFGEGHTARTLLRVKGRHSHDPSRRPLRATRRRYPRAGLMRAVSPVDQRQTVGTVPCEQLQYTSGGVADDRIPRHRTPGSWCSVCGKRTLLARERRKGDQHRKSSQGQPKDRKRTGPQPERQQTRAEKRPECIADVESGLIKR